MPVLAHATGRIVSIRSRSTRMRGRLHSACPPRHDPMETSSARNDATGGVARVAWRQSRRFEAAIQGDTLAKARMVGRYQRKDRKDSLGGIMAVGDRGKAPNTTGTQPRKRVDAPAEKPGRKSLKSAAGRGAGHPKHGAARSSGLRTSETRTAGPKKTRARTTTRSADK
jgi:hypothetical protein